MSFPWHSGTHAALVARGNHSLYLTAAGPPRPMTNTHLQPAIIIEAGLCSGLTDYDRAGYGLSEPSPAQNYTAENRIRELAQLLDITGIEPPYVLVGHSYGGMLVREFLRQYPDQMAGMVLVDSARTRTKLPSDTFDLLGESTYYGSVGLDENHVVSEEEYAAIKEDEKRNMSTAEIEESYMETSTQIVNDALPEGCPVLGDGRLSVIFATESVDFTKLYMYAVENNVGTEDARQRLAVRLQDMGRVDEYGQRAHLGLSRQSRFVYAEGMYRTHRLQYVTPEVIRDEVTWVLGLSE
ncbi:alpha/beta fold hydrolase [Aspergillus ibericus CBS 121593]|uniref:AB hydrolase-1 domain-containing protein n=1 Tax=Aspergillus ibericus CBS 121593 TaxID=1448316 RepID=A0A395H097_9EURO|nr:hypothetical protein BO80DRAFT_445077 [Aspergillus ibericus CBS 121593]RAL00759.1 hypothetical protein BO80DRAFT_445077 [Aspergillus ibericus CBS 121593]